MSVQCADESMTTRNTTTDFFRFAVPSVLGLLAISSAGIVDGIFVGNYVGATALASVNLVVPMFSVFFGLCVMIMVGSGVVAGKAKGAGDLRQTSNIFTKSLVIVTLYSLVATGLGWVYAAEVAAFLGAKGDSLALTTKYIRALTPFLWFMGITFSLSYFARIDGAPNYALAGLVITALTNVVLDALFIEHWGWGVVGAALASGCAYVVGAFFFSLRLFGKQTQIRLIKPYGSWFGLLRAAYNGLSELINEMSAGLLMFTINWILISEAGTTGVAAFTIVNYGLWLSITIGYGIAEALGSLVSVNFGAGKPERIVRFVVLAIGMNVIIGVVFVAVLQLYPQALASAFLSDDKSATLTMTLGIIGVIWPIFLFNGINITISGYFTGMHCATQSAAVALSRSLILPLAFILLFWRMFGLEGAFIALPIAEALTVVLSVILLCRARPARLVARDRQASTGLGTKACQCFFEGKGEDGV